MTISNSIVPSSGSLLSPPMSIVESEVKQADSEEIRQDVKKFIVVLTKGNNLTGIAKIIFDYVVVPANSPSFPTIEDIEELKHVQDIFGNFSIDDPAISKPIFQYSKDLKRQYLVNLFYEINPFQYISEKTVEQIERINFQDVIDKQLISIWSSRHSYILWEAASHGKVAVVRLILNFVVESDLKNLEKIHKKIKEVVIPLLERQAPNGWMLPLQQKIESLISQKINSKSEISSQGKACIIA